MNGRSSISDVFSASKKKRIMVVILMKKVLTVAGKGAISINTLRATKRTGWRKRLSLLVAIGNDL
jgi:hypothetical protein